MCFKLVSCINHITSLGTSRLDLQFCAVAVYSIPVSPPLQLMEQLRRKHLACESLLYSIRSHCSCDHKEPGKKQELHKIVTQKHEYKT